MKVDPFRALVIKGPIRKPTKPVLAHTPGICKKCGQYHG